MPILDLRHSVALISVSSFASSSSSFGFFSVCDNEYYSCIVVYFLFCLLLFVCFCFSSVKCNSRAINLTFLALAFVYLLRLLRFLFVCLLVCLTGLAGFVVSVYPLFGFWQKSLFPRGVLVVNCFRLFVLCVFVFLFSAEDVYNG